MQGYRRAGQTRASPETVAAPLLLPPPIAETVLDAGDGVRVALSSWTRARSTAVIVAPGFFRSRISPMLVRLAEHLAARHDVYCFDFRGHGTSSGRYTFGRHETRDFGAVLDHVHRRGHARVAVVGFSMGGTVAVRALGGSRRGGVDPGVAALVTVSSPTEVFRLRPGLPPRGLLGASWRGESHRLPRLDSRTLFRPHLGTLDEVAWISPTPYLVLHHERDWLVPCAMGEALHRAAREPRRIHVFRTPERLHADALVRAIPDQLYAVLDPFLAENLAC